MLWNSTGSFSEQKMRFLSIEALDNEVCKAMSSWKSLVEPSP